MNAKPFPVAIVGAGPIGIEVAVALSAAGIQACILEAGVLGNTISWWAPQTRWFSSNDRIAIAGVPLGTVDQAKASREEYLNYLRGVVSQFQLDVRTQTRVEAIEPTPDRKSWRLSLRISGDETIHYMDASAVVLAVGGTDHPNRLNVPGESLPHVDGYLREIHRYFGRRVLIVGGRNSAVEAAIRLHRGGAKVSLCYRGETLPMDNIKYWLRPEIEGLIASGAITAYLNANVSRITPTQVEISQVDQTVNVPADDVLTLIGYHQDQSLFEQLQLKREGETKSPVFDPETMETSRPGIYVAGTAIGGTQTSKYVVYLENCHHHADKIVSHLMTTRDAPVIDSHQQTTTDPTLSKRISMQPES